jgi:enoyl-CoA hydratase/carnithine racemase
VDELFRHLSSYHHDHSVENIWIESKLGVFSHGADYKQLSENPDYLDKLCKLAVLIAKINKPTIAEVSGGVKGIAAYVLTMLNSPLGHPGAFLKLDEVVRGFVPIMGGTHRLTRLPLHLGYYLALTGD